MSESSDLGRPQVGEVPGLAMPVDSARRFHTASGTWVAGPTASGRTSLLKPLLDAMGEAARG